MNNRWQFLANRIGEMLWVKPLLMCFISLAAALLASFADNLIPHSWVPDISFESIKVLLTIISSSMLVIATFAVGSMVSAYASATTAATPRAFSLIVADDVSQNALSAFIGAFIFSIISLIALLNGLYDKAGRFTLFALTLIVFAMVIITFVRWVDRIARLGRLETSIACVEAATVTALDQWITDSHLGGTPVTLRDSNALPVFSDQIGYVQQIEINKLQRLAESVRCHVEVASLPGTFLGPQQPIAYIVPDPEQTEDIDLAQFGQAFRIGNERTFDEDPRYGLIVLAEIASRALSPGINDAGTAIQVIGVLVRIIAHCGKSLSSKQTRSPRYDRVAVPELSMEDTLDDAFRAISRDGAASIEVVVSLQNGLQSLASSPNSEFSDLILLQAQRALARAELELTAPADLVLARELARFAQRD